MVLCQLEEATLTHTLKSLRWVNAHIGSLHPVTHHSLRTSLVCQNHLTQLGTDSRDVSRPFTIRAKCEVPGCDRHFAFQDTHNHGHIAFPRHFGSNNLVLD